MFGDFRTHKFVIDNRDGSYRSEHSTSSTNFNPDASPWFKQEIGWSATYARTRTQHASVQYRDLEPRHSLAVWPTISHCKKVKPRALQAPPRPGHLCHVTPTAHHLLFNHRFALPLGQSGTRGTSYDPRGFSTPHVLFTCCCLGACA